MNGARSRAGGCLALLWWQREAFVSLGLGFWLAGYWFADGWEQRKALWLLVPLILLCSDRLLATVKTTRWLWVAGALLVFQSLSRLWSANPVAPVGEWYDTALVFALLTALVMVARRTGVGPRILGGLSIVSALVAFLSLGGFYGWGGNSFATERLRIPFIYEDGLNPVLTGLLFGFGAVAAVWFTRQTDWRTRRVFWLALLAVGVFGLMASQSRGAMLAFGAGLAVLLFFERWHLWPALVATVAAVASYFAALLWARGGSDAAEDLLVRGSSGRFAIYDWFFEKMNTVDGVIGKGMGTPAVIPAEELGWFVHHPHSSYLTQLYLTGTIGLGLLLFVIGWAAREALHQARREDSLWLAMLASGATAILFDGGQVFSLFSDPRIEFLLMGVPAALLIGRVEAERLV